MAINPTTGQDEVLGYDPTQVGIPGVNMPSEQTDQVGIPGVNTPVQVVPPVQQDTQQTQTVQPVAQPTVTQQPTTKAVEQKPIEVPTSIDEWKKQGSNMGTLEQMIEKSYGTVAENKNGVLQANIGGVDYQWTIDQAGNPIKTKVGGEDSQLIFSQLMAGKKFDDTGIQTTPEFYKAKARYDVANQYMGMGEEQLYNAYLNGDIGSELEKDLLGNPYLSLAKDKVNKKTVTDSINKDSVTMLNAYNKVNNDKYTPVTVQKTPLEMLSDKFMASFESTGKTDQIDSFKNYMQTNYPNIVTDSLKLNGKTQELQKLTDERDKRLDEIIKENPGISINRATMLAARQNKDINAQIQSMGYEIQNLSANLKYQTDMANQEYTYAIQQQERKDAIEKEKRAYLYQQIETQQALEASQAQAEAKQQQQDFENAIKLQELQSKLGDRKTTVIKDEATGEQKLIDSQTGEIIQSFKTGLKPDTMSPYQQAQTELDKQKLALDQKKFDAEKGLIDTSISNGVVPSIEITSKWGRAEKGPVQCGEFVNDSLKEKGITGVNFGNNYTDKINAINKLGLSDKPLPGSVFVLKTGEKEGHTGIVQSVNADGSIVVQEANRDATDEGTEPTLGTYKSTTGMTFSKPVILENNKLAEIGQYMIDNQERGVGYSKEDVEAFNEKIKRFIKNGDEEGMAKAFRKNIFQDKKFSDEFDNTQKFTTALDDVGTMINNYANAGKSTNALKAMAEKVARKIGVSTDEALAQLQTQMGFTLANYIRSISGTAASDVEVQRLMGNMANIGNVKELNVALVGQAKQNALSSIKSMINTRMYGLPEDLKQKVFGDVYTQPQENKTETTQFSPAIQNIKKTYLNY